MTKDLKKLGYDASPRKDMPFAGIGGTSSVISTGFDPDKANPASGRNLDQQESEAGVQVL